MCERKAVELREGEDWVGRGRERGGKEGGRKGGGGQKTNQSSGLKLTLLTISPIYLTLAHSFFQ